MKRIYTTFKAMKKKTKKKIIIFSMIGLILLVIGYFATYSYYNDKIRQIQQEQKITSKCESSPSNFCGDDLFLYRTINDKSCQITVVLNNELPEDSGLASCAIDYCRNKFQSSYCNEVYCGIYYHNSILSNDNFQKINC